MMLTWPIVLLGIFQAAAATAPPVATVPAAATVPMHQETFHHLVLKNADVAVYDVRLPVGAQMKYHAHPTNHLALVIDPGVMLNEVAGQPPKDNPTGPGGTLVYVSAGPAHRQKNIDRAPIRFIAIELLKSVRAATVHDGADRRSGPSQETGCRVEVDETDIRAWRCQLSPGESVPARAGAGRALRNGLTAGTLQETAAGAATHDEKLSIGDSVWHAQSGRALKNVGSARLDYIEVEWK
jgi:quercetin dioxygenase-like cupin family protein